MSFKWSDQIPWLGLQENKGVGTNLKAPSVATECPKRWPWFDVRVLGLSLMSVIPWAVNAKDKFRMPTTVNKDLKRRARSRAIDSTASNRSPRLRFRPYVSKVPWHTGVRAFLSQLFPRYGHYCGPNWSSGKNGGSLIWDKRPIDWLDYCCYCHDIGYDTYEQDKLLEADLAFLECLEQPHMRTVGDKHVANLYKTMCIHGLKNVLIPYRTHLVKLQSGQPLIQFGWLSNVWWGGWNARSQTSAKAE